jgi:hypothetical protein
MGLILDSAYISSDMYYDQPGTNTKNAFSVGVLSKQAQNIPADGWYRIDGIPFSTPPSLHYYAALYLKFEQGEALHAVIAFRGTVMKAANLFVDLTSWCSDVMGDGSHAVTPPLYYSFSLSFTQACMNYLKNSPFSYLASPGRYTYAGHSLGGALAQLMATASPYPAKAIAFNSPGCGNISVVNNNLCPNVTNINARFGLINKAGKPTGPVTYVEVTERENEAKALFRSEDKSAMQLSELLFKESNSPLPTSNIIDLIGILAREKAYLSTAPTVAKMPETQKKIAQCKTEKSPWSFLAFPRPQLKQYQCDLLAILDTYTDIIMAQHGIDNVISAMRRSGVQ